MQQICAKQIKNDIPEFRVGDSLRISLRIIEGEKERIQVFSGTVIARQGAGSSETIILHRVAYGCSIERVFYLHSPKIAKIEVTRRGKVRRAKLYNLRGAFGKKAKVKELIGPRKADLRKAAASAENQEEIQVEETEKVTSEKVTVADSESAKTVEVKTEEAPATGDASKADEAPTQDTSSKEGEEKA